MNPSTKKDVVLVVDDAADSLSFINDILDQAGYTVLVALEGQQAINIANNITPDIILLDAIMPNMDGFETCRQLKASRDLEHIPVIFMTGLSDNESIVKGLECGGVDYIQKPVDSDVLLARMRVHLQNARLTLSARAALDMAGQYLMATDASGKLLWATPQAHYLFAAKGVQEEGLYNELASAIQPLILQGSDLQQGIVIEINNIPLKIRYISQTGDNEFLLRLIDLEKPSETEQLRNTFELTERESEVLLWIAKGKSNSEIGVILGVSPRTVNKHLEQIFRKLNVENRTSAAVMALKEIQEI